MENIPGNVLSERLFLLVPLLHNHLIKPMESIMREHISPMQFYTLIALWRQDGMTMSELASYFSIPKQQMTKIIHRLCEMGFVARRADTGDRRAVQVKITPLACDYLKHLRMEICDSVNIKLEELSNEEQSRLLLAIDTLQQFLPRFRLDAGAQTLVFPQNTEKKA